MVFAARTFRMNCFTVVSQYLGLAGGVGLGVQEVMVVASRTPPGQRAERGSNSGSGSGRRECRRARQDLGQ